MGESLIHRSFAPLRKLLPGWLSNAIRSVVTAVLTPVLYSYRTGHFRSSLRMAAVSRHGEPIPWYTYPAIDFLSGRDFRSRTVLEFGGGQSTLWWAARAKSVVTFEDNLAWHDRIKAGAPPNAELHYVADESGTNHAAQVKAVLATLAQRQYDVIVIDGLKREDMIEIACAHVAPDGIVVCDNADGYGFYEGFKQRPFRRVDFYGNAPGVILPQCTSIYFGPSSFAFGPEVPIRVISEESQVSSDRHVRVTHLATPLAVAYFWSETGLRLSRFTSMVIRRSSLAAASGRPH
jgi:hypothetical protein